MLGSEEEDLTSVNDIIGVEVINSFQDLSNGL